MSEPRLEANDLRAIMAFVYTDGIEADRFIAKLGYQLRSQGCRVAGIVQHNDFVRNRTKCDMNVEELASETVLRLSENRGAAARGCRLDRAALLDAETLLRRAIDQAPDIVIINKFGRVEAEGGGLREVIVEAVARELPMIIGVPYRNIHQWRAFAGDFAIEATDAARVLQWLQGKGFGIANLPASHCGAVAIDERSVALGAASFRSE
jgi:nucleoside-triphosphatase THEP1